MQSSAQLMLHKFVLAASVSSFSDVSVLHMKGCFVCQLFKKRQIPFVLALWDKAEVQWLATWSQISPPHPKTPAGKWHNAGVPKIWLGIHRRGPSLNSQLQSIAGDACWQVGVGRSNIYINLCAASCPTTAVTGSRSGLWSSLWSTSTLELHEKWTPWSNGPMQCGDHLV